LRGVTGAARGAGAGMFAVFRGRGQHAGGRRAEGCKGTAFLTSGGDRATSRAMIANCWPHLSRELALLRPEVVIPVGGLAVKELLGIGWLSEAVGETIVRDGVVYVPLPHPSGASTWLNLPENRGRLFRALAVLGRLVADGRIGGSGARARRLKS
jgi:Uracil DNA glycosylase superfamily